MSTGRTHRQGVVQGWRWLNRNAAAVAIVLALVTVITVFIGVWQPSPVKTPAGEAIAWHHRVSDALYEAAQALLLNMDPHEGNDWWFTIGRFSAVLLVFFLGLQGVGRLLADSWQRLRLTWWVQQHAIVCGLGKIGWQLAQDLLRQGRWVVIIEPNEEHPHRRQALDLGAVVLTGDATDADVLRDGRLHDARDMYVATGSNEANVEIALDAQQILAERRENEIDRSTLDVHVHISDPAFSDILRGRLHQFQSPLLADGQGQQRTLQPKIFNAFHTTARKLIVEQLVAHRPIETHEVALYVLVGFGRMGQALALHLAELAHFENRKRSRLWILAPRSEADNFRSRWGQFAPAHPWQEWKDVAFDVAADEWGARDYHPEPAYQVADERAIEYVCNTIFSPQPSYLGDLSFLQTLQRLTSEPGVKPTVLVCLDEDAENFAAASALEQSLRSHFQRTDLPIYCWLPRQEPLVRLLAQSAGSPLQAFGDCQTSISLDEVQQPLTDRLGLAILADYRGWNLEDAQGRKQALETWHADSEVFRHSNQMAAVHALIKLRCLGYELEPLTAGESWITSEALTATDDQLLVLAQMEHNRWNAERLLAGWQWGLEKSNHPPRRPQLCTWDVLAKLALERPEFAKEPQKDFQQVQAVFARLPKLGYRVVRRASPPTSG